MLDEGAAALDAAGAFVRARWNEGADPDADTSGEAVPAGVTS